MSAGQTLMLEHVYRVAGSDEAALSQVQQTAARGEAHVQGKLALTADLHIASPVVSSSSLTFARMQEAIHPVWCCIVRGCLPLSTVSSCASPAVAWSFLWPEVQHAIMPSCHCAYWAARHDQIVVCVFYTQS